MSQGLNQSLAGNGIPRIDHIAPAAAIPGGEITVYGSGFATANHVRPQVSFGEVEGSVLFQAQDYLIVKVPESGPGMLRVITSTGQSQAVPVSLGHQIADNLHPVASPAVDHEGNIYVTFSGQRGRRVPVPLYKITANFTVKPYVTQLINPSGLALDREGLLYVSCRHDGTIHRVTPDGRTELWVEGMGIATGLAFDHEGNLYVGDRSGTIFKINRERQIFVFATIEPSIAFYHLAFHATSGDLYVSGPTTSSYDRIYRITPGGEPKLFYRGLGRPQGLAFDRAGNLYVAASLGGRRGIVRLTPEAKAELVLSGSDLVGLALLPTHRAYLTTTGALFSIDWDVEGAALPV